MEAAAEAYEKVLNDVIKLITTPTTPTTPTTRHFNKGYVFMYV